MIAQHKTIYFIEGDLGDPDLPAVPMSENAKRWLLEAYVTLYQDILLSTAEELMGEAIEAAADEALKEIARQIGHAMADRPDLAAHYRQLYDFEAIALKWKQIAVASGSPDAASVSAYTDAVVAEKQAAITLLEEAAGDTSAIYRATKALGEIGGVFASALEYAGAIQDGETNPEGVPGAFIGIAIGGAVEAALVTAAGGAAVIAGLPVAGIVATALVITTVAYAAAQVGQAIWEDFISDPVWSKLDEWGYGDALRMAISDVGARLGAYLPGDPAMAPYTVETRFNGKATAANEHQNIVVGNDFENEISMLYGRTVAFGGDGDDIYRVFQTADGNQVISDTEGSNSLYFGVENVASLQFTRLGERVYQTAGAYLLSLVEGVEDTTNLIVFNAAYKSTVTLLDWHDGDFGINLGLAPSRPEPVNELHLDSLQRLGDIYGSVSYKVTADTGATGLGAGVSGGSGDDWVVGDIGDNLLFSGGGGDRLEGGQGNDVLLAGSFRPNWTPQNLLPSTTEGTFSHGDGWMTYSGEAGSAGEESTAGYFFSLTVDVAYRTASNGPFNFFDANATPSGSDILEGGNGADIAYGGEGNDSIDGGDGDDALMGGADGDVITGGDGDDLIIGDDLLNGRLWQQLAEHVSSQADVSGSDMLYGGDGQDRIYGGGGNDVIEGGEDDDILEGDQVAYGSQYSYALAGVEGDDYIDGGAGNDFIAGDGGNDTLLGGEGADHLIGDSILTPGAAHGTDLLDGGSGNDVLEGYGGNDELHGGTGDDLLAGDSLGAEVDSPYHGNDALYGEDGNDELQGNGGDDLLDGGTGDDRLFGQDGNDVLVGGDGVDQLQGGTGDDALSGGRGKDTLYGDAGNDTLDGGDDDDGLSGGDGVDRLSGGAGNDVMFGDAGDDLLFGDAGDDALEGGTGNDSIYGGDGNDLVHGGDGNDVLQGNDGVDELTGAAGDDTLDGGRGDDHLDGAAGDDILVGGAGNDYLNGGVGFNRYVISVGDGDDQIDSIGDTAAAGTQVDGELKLTGGLTPENVRVERQDQSLKLYYEGGSVFIENYFRQIDPAVDPALQQAVSVAPVTRIVFDDGTTWALAEVKNLVMTATSGDDIIRGFESGDLIDGGEGDDEIYGLGGNDTLLGGGGRDVLDGGNGDDDLRGGAGDDVLFGGNGSNHLDGGDGNDILWVDGGGSSTLLGGTGNDTLNGSYANEVFDGGSGDDVFYGNNGNDVYLFGVGSGSDEVRRGELGSTTIRLSAGLTPQDVDFVLEPYVTGGFTLRIKLHNDEDSLLMYGLGVIDWDSGALVIGDRQFSVQFSDGTMLNARQVFDAAVAAGNVPSSMKVGAAGADVMAGTSEYDLFGMEGDDVLNAGYSATTLWGGAGNDTLLGGSGWDELRGGDGDDYLYGGTGNDRLLGGQGSDTFFYQLGDGVDTITDAGGTSLAPRTGMDVLQLGSGIDPDQVTVRMDGANYVLSFINSPYDQIILSAQLMNDGTAQLNQNGAIEKVQFANGVIWDQSTLLAKVPKNTINGTAGNDTLNGTSGMDLLRGYAGDDILDGKFMFDWMEGGSGNDTYVVDNADDKVVELAGEGDDLVRASVSYVLPAEVERITITGTSQSVRATGNALANILTGTTYYNELYGMDGDDVLDGKGGSDLLVGGAGDDLYIAYAYENKVIEKVGEGIDTVQSGYSHTLGENVERLILTGTSAINGTGNAQDNYLLGNAAANTLLGNAGNDVLDGGAGADGMEGGVGDDSYFVDNINDRITESSSAGMDSVRSSVTFTLSTNVENLTLVGSAAINGTGNAQDNLLIGNEAVNTLTGAAGADVLDGGAGADMLVGGVGADTYRFGLGYGSDRIFENDSAVNVVDQLVTLAGIAYDQLWFTHPSGSNDLEISVIGTTDKVVIQDWYKGSRYQVEKMVTADGHVLRAANVQTLVAAMAGLAPPAAGETTLSQAQRDALATALASWETPAAASAASVSILAWESDFDPLYWQQNLEAQRLMPVDSPLSSQLAPSASMDAASNVMPDLHAMVASLAGLPPVGAYASAHRTDSWKALPSMHQLVL